MVSIMIFGPVCEALAECVHIRVLGTRLRLVVFGCLIASIARISVHLGRFARPDAFRRGIGSVVPGMEGREANDVYLEQSSLSDVLPFLDAITEDGCQKGDGGQVKRELRQALPNVEKDRVHGKWKESRAARPASPRVLGPELR